jgi:carboxyl-terminal processing protease
MAPAARFLVVIGTCHHTHGIALTRRALGGAAAAACPLAACAEVYEGSAPIELVDDVVKAVGGLFYDEAMLASPRWSAAVKRAQTAARDADDAAAAPGIVADLLQSLNDPYTRFKPPALAEATLANAGTKPAGVGLKLAPGVSGIEIVEVLPGSPAATSALRPGDVLVEIDESAAASASAASATEALRGRAGSTVSIKASRGGNKIIERLVRAQLDATAPEVEARGVADGVGVLAVRSFSGATPSAIEGAVTQLRRDGAKGLALDLRGNGGGDLDAAVRAVDLFLDGGKTIATIRARTGVTVKSASGPAPVREPVVVLVDAGTASAAELFSAALSSNRRATLVGQQTYGKARVQRAAPIPGGGAVLVSRALYVTPAGIDLTNVGLTPDAPCAAGEDALACARKALLPPDELGYVRTP